MTRAIAAALVGLCVAQGAGAHDWYTGTKNEQGQLCCGGYDCTTIPYDAVRCDATGCDVTITPGSHPMVPPERFGTEPRVFRFTGTPSVSPDLANHACITKREAELGIARCVWIGSGI